MEKHQKCLDFTRWFEDMVNIRPGMLGSVSDMSAMFYIVDNINNILLFDEVLPRELSWIEFLIDRKLVRGSKIIPAEDGWDFERFSELRRQYLKWVEVRRVGNLGEGASSLK
jgi:hypothetical protein